MTRKSQSVDLKGEMSLMNVLLLHSADTGVIELALHEKQREVGQYLAKSPVIIDCSALGDVATELDFSALWRVVSATGLVPVGIRNLPESAEGGAVEAGWALLRPGRSQTQIPPVVERKVEQVRDTQRLMVIERLSVRVSRYTAQKVILS